MKDSYSLLAALQLEIKYAPAGATLYHAGCDDVGLLPTLVGARSGLALGWPGAHASGDGLAQLAVVQLFALRLLVGDFVGADLVGRVLDGCVQSGGGRYQAGREISAGVVKLSLLQVEQEVGERAGRNASGLHLL